MIGYDPQRQQGLPSSSVTAINCGVEAIAPTGAGGREIAVLWAQLDIA
jgi:hypothetical protein